MTPSLLLYLVTEDWAFMSHRRPTAEGAVAAGFRIGVLAREDKHSEAIRALGYEFHPLKWARRSLNPFAALQDIAEITSLYRRLRPRIVHHVALKAALLGGIAAHLARVPQHIAAVNGVGFIFTDSGMKARLLRLIFVPLLRAVLRYKNVMVWFQNPDDRDLFIALKIAAPEQCVILRGSGVDTDALPALPEPPLPVTCAYAGRMLHSKGIDVLVEAVGLCRRQDIDLRLLLAGLPDDNPTSFTAAQLTAWGKRDGIEYLGQVTPIDALWRRAHIAVLPCRVREGVPKALLDAASCARPIVASDIEGVREIARNGANAITVPPGDAAALADALAKLADDAALRHRLGAAGRDLVMDEMSARAIREKAAAIYRGFLTKP